MKKLMTIVVMAAFLVLAAIGGEEARGDTFPVDHYKCYSAKTKTGTSRFEPQEVLLADQFEAKVTQVLRSDFVCTPVSKDGGEIIDPETHLKCYFIKEALPPFEPRDVAVQDQFGNETLTLFKPQLLCVPAKKVEDEEGPDFVPPTVFQAAGPTVASIQGTVDAYRAALGDPNNGNAPGVLTSGRREINWDGGSTTNQTTATAGNPFAGFQGTRGALFTTPDGTGFVQAPPAADPALFPPGGLAGLFSNPTYEAIFSTFSPLRLFSAIGGKVTDVTFTVPGDPTREATVSGFGAVFTDVDQPDGSNKHRRASTLIKYFGPDGELLFSSFAPASPGDGSLSFFGIVFDDARIARVRITSGNVAPGPDDGGEQDVVMMDDFLYGEPQPLP